MRIVHINDCAFVGASLVRQLRDKGHDIEHITRSRSIFSKTFGIAWRILRTRDADIYHAHYALQDAYFTRILKRLDVLHCHGSDVRWRINGAWGWIVRSNLRHARKVLVSTPDLLNRALEYNSTAEYLPNPVDTEFFKPKAFHHECCHKPRALYFILSYEQLPSELESALAGAGFVLDKVAGRPFRFEEMPNVLSQYDLFIGCFTIDAFTKTCLEAMSCGLSTITYKDKGNLRARVNDLVDAKTRLEEGRKNREYIVKCHDAGRVAERLLRIYEDLL